MKKLKSRNEYKASNVVFDADNMTAYSYGWWRFVDKIGNKVIFNDYRYSPSTGGHQSKVSSVMSDLGIKIDEVVHCPKGLQNLESGIGHYEYLIKELVGEINAPRSQKAKNSERASDIKGYQSQIKLIKTLQKSAN